MATTRVERRLSAILAADVVGYSRLMERDEAGTLERLKAAQGADRAGPRPARRPLRRPQGRRRHRRVRQRRRRGRRAVEIQRACSPGPGSPEAERIRYRIGINLGDVSSTATHLRRRRQRGGPDRASVRAGRGAAVAQRLRPGQGQA